MNLVSIKLLATNDKVVSLNTNNILDFSEKFIWNKLNSNIDYPIRSFADPITIFSVHSTEYWDSNNYISPSLNKLKSLAKVNNLLFYFLASNDERKLMHADESINTLPYEGDSHFYQSLESVAFAGGNFTQCLCNAIRASIIIDSYQKQQKIYILTDVVYEIPLPSILSSDDKIKLRPNGYDRNRLDELITYMGPVKFFEYLKKDWIAKDGLPCPLYDPPFLSFKTSRSSAIKFIVNGLEVGTIGKDQNIVIINFLTIDDFISKIKK